MKINPKYNIGEIVIVGPYLGRIISISIHPGNELLYNVAYWMNGIEYVTRSFYEFGIEKDEGKLGFVKKEG